MNQSYHWQRQYLQSDYQRNSIYQQYELSDHDKHGAFYYGIGFDLFSGKKFDINVAIMKNSIDDKKSEISAVIGFKMLLDFGSRSTSSPF